MLPGVSLSQRVAQAGQGVGEKVSCLLGWKLGWRPPVGEQEWGEVTARGKALGILSLSLGQVTACVLA